MNRKQAFRDIRFKKYLEDHIIETIKSIARVIQFKDPDCSEEIVTRVLMKYYQDKETKDQIKKELNISDERLYKIIEMMEIFIRSHYTEYTKKDISFMINCL